MRSLRGDRRGSALPYAIIGLIGLISVIVAFLVFPQYFLGLIFAFVGVLVLVVYKANPYALWVGFSSIIVAAVFILVANAQTLSLSVAHML